MSQTPDYTANGVEITVGLRVFTNDLRLGTVVKLADDGWHYVLEDGVEADTEAQRLARSRSFNGERLTTRHPFSGAIAR